MIGRDSEIPNIKCFIKQGSISIENKFHKVLRIGDSGKSPFCCREIDIMLVFDFESERKQFFVGFKKKIIMILHAVEHRFYI
ncbi:hypothetical protein SDC9_83520 [bioreactor metagenome]|uniref:Uncharacterized protein n=1 Tax=bioreactor metagenome TaxID=1076179 RepID=A0A644Z7T4_9ZZZZ